MKRSKRTAIIIALICIIAGSVIVALSLFSIGFDFTNINTMSYNKVSHTINESYNSIDISDIECDVIIKYRSNSKDITLIESSETDKIISTIEVEDNTLIIKRIDTRSWYERIIVLWRESPTLTVYLPAEKYNLLKISTASADVYVTDAFEFNKTEIKTVSGDIKFKPYSGDLILKSTSGNITCADADTLTVGSTSGDISVLGVNASNLDLKTTSGDIKIGELLLKEKAIIKTTSGDIEFEYIDGEGSIHIKTTSGDIEGTIHRNMNYIPKTTSGEIDIPRSSDSSPDCKLTTTSGDIEIIERIEDDKT